MLENTKIDIIKCPTCGAEYLPSEIFIPAEFFGRPIKVERDNKHHIIDIIGSGMNTNEHYTCDYCNVPFRIIAKTQYNTKAEVKFNFNDDYTTSLKKESLFLNED